MKTRYILITLLCFALIALLLITNRYFTVEPEPIPEPERDWGGLKVQQMVAEPEPSTEPKYEMYFTEDDVVSMAKMLWGEARGCTRDNQIKCAWIVVNRVDDERFPDTIQGVLEQPSQFHGYSESFPVTDELYSVAFDVLTRWSYEKQGIPVRRELASSFLWFTGNGVENIFREVY